MLALWSSTGLKPFFTHAHTQANLQMLLSPVWVSSFSYHLKCLQELQADQRITYVLVSSIGPMCVKSRGKVDRGATAP